MLASGFLRSTSWSARNPAWIHLSNVANAGFCRKSTEAKTVVGGSDQQWIKLRIGPMTFVAQSVPIVKIEMIYCDQADRWAQQMGVEVNNEILE